MIKKLVEVQSLLKAPKGQFNKFGNYKYRSAEDVLEAVKPLLHERGLLITVSDEITQIGDRIYVTATVTLHDGDGKTLKVTASAREALTKKGMDESQITGAASSYARKYALNGMFAIDDTKDADGYDNREQQTRPSKRGGEDYNKPANLDETPKAGKVTEDQKSEIKRLMGALNLDGQGLANMYKTQYGKAIQTMDEESAMDFIAYLLNYEEIQAEEQAAAQRG